jgi:hypothetical protein
MLWPGSFQGYLVEKFGGGNESVDAFRRIAALDDHVELILPDLFQAEVGRTGLVESGQTGDVMQVRSLGFAAEVA